MRPVRFAYRGEDRGWRQVTTLEEDEYPYLSHRDREQPEHGREPEVILVPVNEETGELTQPVAVAQVVATPTVPPATDAMATTVEPAEDKPAAPAKTALKEGHVSFQEGRRGFSYEKFFGPYLRGATEITVKDPFIRMPHQMRNLMELIETIAKVSDAAAEVKVNLTTKPDETAEMARKQIDGLKTVRTSALIAGIDFDYEFSETLHDRSIQADSGWLIVLGRGLDVFQPFDTNWLDLRLRQQRYRAVKEFEITYVRQEPKTKELS
jgi:ATP-dependent Lon protease